MNNLTSFVVWCVVFIVAFAIAWRLGWLNRIAQYARETREELRKCTWPSGNELWGSTVIVMVATALLGTFTVVVDLLAAWIVRAIV